MRPYKKQLTCIAILAALACVIGSYYLSGNMAAVFASPQEVGLDPTFAPAITDGYTRVEAVAVQPDGKVLIGGDFPIASGQEVNTLARLNPDGSLDVSFTPPNLNSIIFDIVVQPDGKILVSGNQKVIRLNSDGSIDPTFTSGTGPNSSVNDVLRLSTGKILISGNFSQYNGAPASRVARLNADGTLDASFSVPSINSTVQEAAEQSDGKIVLVGTFSTIGGVSRRSVARLNTDGSLDTAFNGGTIYSNRPSVAIQDDGKILVGGLQNDASEPLGIVRFSPDGTLDPTFSPGFSSVFGTTVHKILVLPDGSILAGGGMALSTASSENDLHGVIKLTTTGGLDPAFSPQKVVGDGLEIFSIALKSDGKIVGGGDLYRLGITNTTTKRIAQLNANGTIDSSFTGSVEGFGTVIDSVKQPDGKTIVVGGFRSVNGAPRQGVARIDTAGNVDPTFDAAITITISLVAVALQDDGKVLVGGGILTVNGATVSVPVLRLNADGSLDSGFLTALQNSMNANNIYGFAQPIADISVLPDGKILVANYFADDSGSRMLLRLNPDGSIDTTFNARLNSYASKILAQPDGKIVVAGYFTSVNSVARGRIARLNADGSLDTSFDPGTGANSSIYAAAMQPDGRVIVGGYFTTFNGTPANRIVRLNSNGTVDPGFNTGTGADAFVQALELQPDGEVWVGGSFTQYNGQPAAALARLDTNGGLITSYTSELNRLVGSLAYGADGSLLVGGTFTKYGQADRKGLLRLVPQTTQPQPAMFDFDGDGKTDASVYRPSNNVWYLQRSTAGFTAYQFGTADDKPVPADYTGDGKTDVAMYRPSTGTWYVLRSEDLTFYAVPFGIAADTPTPGDFDGDGKADIAVYRPEAQSTFYVQRSTEGFTAVQFGLSEDKPTPGDFDGDGKADIAVFRPSTGVWYRLNSSNGSFYAAQFGSAGDKVVPADYTGDGKVDIAVWRPSSGMWYILRSENESVYGVPFGASGDVPVAGDYDGDATTDVAVFRPSDGMWYISKSSGGYMFVPFGVATDVPIPSAYVP
ncbi:MAG: VCBS repeat-containing protein [Acidobacteria bacterium]|nr:VCBS repeat-containing protein [Acidobacteriota bacterium]